MSIWKADYGANMIIISQNFNVSNFLSLLIKWQTHECHGLLFLSEAMGGDILVTN